MSVLCLHFQKVKIRPMLGFQYFLRSRCGCAQESVGSFPNKFLEDAALAGPCCQCMGTPSAGTDFLSWIWWERDLQLFPLNLGWQMNRLRRLGPHV